MKANIQLSKLEQTVFYTIEKTIKSYRQFAQKNIKHDELDITIDQWLVLKTLADEPGISQKEMAKAVFKDNASIARMIELLVKKKYLIRSFHREDRRRYQLKMTALGKTTYEQLIPIVHANRTTALAGISNEEVALLSSLLQRITDNCQHQPIDEA
ncbi:MAG: MarR family transcriptional regulator [Bacteroidota bacterium]